ncbi:hypothetical protein NPIL_154941 [Nephila pilipes]|uniref:Uncharacterized protein n=1 Tax=Nephila pilipes TaxID=299642 RepID=A0A8X6UGE5_NEPPI|nr:hypothetical protein NPIL_154941 [Nephila pilipes]
MEFNNSNLKSKKKQNLDEAVPTASSLFSGRSSNCINSTSQSSATESIIMLTHNEKIEHFWDLELLGIKKPTEKTSREDVVKFFNDTLSTDLDGRYMVKLSWTDNSSLPDNKNLAEKDY